MCKRDRKVNVLNQDKKYKLRTNTAVLLHYKA